MAPRRKEWIVIIWFIIMVTPNGVAMVHERSEAPTYDYKVALANAILFFEGQRSGKLPENQRVHWRGDSALSDGMPDKVNLMGGYYDAGDNIKFVWPMAFSVTLLSWAATEYQNEISSINQLGYLQSAIRWGADFVLRAHTSPTTLYTQVGDGNHDHQCWERPEDMDTPRTLYKINSSSPGSEAAAEAAAALSAASIVFKEVDSNYSAELLTHSRQISIEDLIKLLALFTAPTQAIRYQDELLWAAAWLYKASGDSRYMSYALNNQGWSQAVSEFSWDNKFAGAQTLLAEEYLASKANLRKYKDDADSFICALMPGSSSAQIHPTPGGLLYTRDSSNLQYVTSASMVLFIYSNILNKAGLDSIQCGDVHFSTAQIKAFAKSQVDYILGNNPMKVSYMVGYGSKYPMQLHHRGSSLPSIHVFPAKIECNQGYSDWYSSNQPNPNTHVGAIVGGPNSNDQFNDARSDYSHLEPTTYMNAAFVGSVAALLTQSQEECLQLLLNGKIALMVDDM
ncbi:Glycoside hydrolase family 9 [Dillenia turbinata]|uniref:Endoglucanase n=1 Tax=Dillenia turbinata TaxID=194707 RepID=A0AAN8VJP2_9MAGN